MMKKLRQRLQLVGKQKAIAADGQQIECNTETDCDNCGDDGLRSHRSCGQLSTATVDKKSGASLNFPAQLLRSFRAKLTRNNERKKGKRDVKPCQPSSETTSDARDCKSNGTLKERTSDSDKDKCVSHNKSSEKLGDEKLADNDYEQYSSVDTEVKPTLASNSPDCAVSVSRDELRLDYADNAVVIVDNDRNSLFNEISNLANHCWYWGPISRREAEKRLKDQDDGAFLVRDSSDERYFFSLSFRSFGKTLHTRIEYDSGLFSFYSHTTNDGHPSLIELIEESVSNSKGGVFCYSRGRSPTSPSFPVRLTRPVSRFAGVRDLQYLCRFVIRQNSLFGQIQSLPIPQNVKGFIDNGHNR